MQVFAENVIITKVTTFYDNDLILVWVALREQQTMDTRRAGGRRTNASTTKSSPYPEM